jgi:ABC-type taurine transport system substrate-binding protein
MQVWNMAQAQMAHAAVVSGFVDSLQEPRTPYISPKRFSKALGVQVAGLAELTGVHRNTLRNPASERLQSRMREMIKAIMAAAELTGDVAKAIYWYRNEPIAEYGHKTAAELVAEGHVEAVLAYVRDLANGARG